MDDEMMLDDAEENNEPYCYCMCGALHSDEEIDWNQCDACGGRIN